jgi:uncharacterized protein with FMN-binding domain
MKEQQVADRWQRAVVALALLGVLAPEVQATPPAGTGKRPQRFREEVETLINEQGRKPPDWWDAIPLEYPKTLDLTWPEPPPPAWNNQRNVGQYIWDIINPNPARYRSGIRFMHHLLSVHKEDPEKRRRAMIHLGHMYQDLLQDYPRAAFWLRRAGVGEAKDDYEGLRLAECYWRLGNKDMAQEVLRRTPLQYATIKLLADMGETDRALEIADVNASGRYADLALMYAGDACRVAGLNQKALRYYERVLEVPITEEDKVRIQRNQNRARANLEGIKLFDNLDLARIADGTYRGSSLGYEAPVHVEVAVREGRIESVRVTEHREKQFYSSLVDTPRKIIDKQHVKGIDATSSATITSEAIINATAKALAKGMK